MELIKNYLSIKNREKTRMRGSFCVEGQKNALFFVPYKTIFPIFFLTVKERRKLKMPEKQILLSLKEVSEMLHISYGKARDFTFEQNMQVHIGRRTLVHKEKLEKWINE